LDCKIVTCALMALEKWLYEEIDAEHDIEQWLAQIMQRVESVAFAGLLIDVGKRQPKYFLGALRPLLGTSVFYLWDHQIHAERLQMNTGLAAWWNQPDELTALAREWHTAQHRRHLLSQVAAWLMLRSAEMQQYFTECAERWRGELGAADQPRGLQVLIEQLDRRNYKATSLDTGEVQIEFVPPAPMLRELESEQVKADDAIRLITFPIDCRRILDGEKRLPPDDLSDFWSTIQAIAKQAEDAEGYRSNGVAGGVAVLLRRHPEWLDADPARMAWCLSELRRIASEPHARREFDFPETVGDWGWDCFLAEAGVCLLAGNPGDQFARELVAIGVAAYHYGTTAKTMRLAYELRQQLGNDFERMQLLATRWSVVSRLLRDSEHYLGDLQRMQPFSEDSAAAEAKIAQLAAEWEKQRDERIRLLESFANGSTQLITLEEARATGTTEVERLASIRFPARSRPSAKKSHEPPRRKTRRADPGVDWEVLKAAFGWLDLSSTRSDGERRAVLDLGCSLLQLVLSTLQPSAELEDEDVGDDDEIDGLPGDFDGWVFGHVARSIAHARDDEEPESMWHLILSLGLHAHEWIERFFWEWFTVGVHTSASPEAFARRWSEMIEFALASPSWDPAATKSRHLDDVVFELLGYHFGLTSIANDNKYAPVLAKMIPVLDLAAQRWFEMPQVANGFARSLVEPAYDGLLCPGIRWL
ncbi:MAG: hypothetical protein B7X10_01185, partial [Burkholderiales bacterium 21-58-4]